MNDSSIQDINIKTTIGNLVFDIMLDSGFFNQDNDWSADIHNHGHYEVHYIINGKGKVFISDRHFELMPKTFYLIRPNIYHKQIEYPSDPIYKYCFRFNYKIVKNKQMEDNFNQANNILTVLNNPRYCCSSNSQSILKDILDIHNELYSKPLGYYAKVQALFVQLIINMLRSFDSEHSENSGHPIKVPDEKRTQIIDNFFSHNYSKNIKLSNLASLLNISESQLNRFLKKTYGLTFKQKLIASRIEAAKYLLENTDMTVEGISERIGYREPANFCTIFKKKTGASPSGYRKSI